MPLNHVKIEYGGGYGGGYDGSNAPTISKTTVWNETPCNLMSKAIIWDHNSRILCAGTICNKWKKQIGSFLRIWLVF